MSTTAQIQYEQDQQALYKKILDTPVTGIDTYGGHPAITTVREFFAYAGAQLWHEEEGFSGKRPFGDSGWAYEIREALDRNGLEEQVMDKDIIEAARSMARPTPVDPIAALRTTYPMNPPSATRDGVTFIEDLRDKTLALAGQMYRSGATGPEIVKAFSALEDVINAQAMAAR